VPALLDAPTLIIDDGCRMEQAVLGMLAGSALPVGSGTLMERLEAGGLRVSEPTVGRLLRQLDRRGYTERVSNKGRVLTKAGRVRFEQLSDAASKSESERALLETMRGGTIEEIVDVLVARRALERESARLAAERATAEDVAAIRAALAQQRVVVGTNGAAVDADERFHAVIARASRNRVLAAAIDLIRRDKPLALRLDAILRRTTHMWVVGHESILAAVERRDPEAAERAMVQHLDTVIAALQEAK
jgi:GntR family transcriptional repressor for pyruvate dehydrogenase complex